MTIRDHPVLYSTTLVLCALFGVAMVLVGLDSASAQETSVLTWQDHIYTADNPTDWDGDTLSYNVTRPHSYAVVNSTTYFVMDVAATLNANGNTAFIDFQLDTGGPDCMVYLNSGGSTTSHPGRDAVYGRTQCPSVTEYGETFDIDGTNNFTFNAVTGGTITNLNINLYLLVQDIVTIPSNNGNGNTAVMTLLEDATGLAGIDYIALFAIIVAAMIVWSRAHDDGVRWFTGLFCMIPGVALLAVSTMAGGDWIFIPIIGAAFIMLGGYLWIKQAFEHLGSTSIQ